jgi:hypothetical protein
LTEAGCTKIFTEQMSGAVTDRPALHDALEFARSGDTLVVWKLDRLARSMKQLIGPLYSKDGRCRRISTWRRAAAVRRFRTWRRPRSEASDSEPNAGIP